VGTVTVRNKKCVPNAENTSLESGEEKEISPKREN
jgi:hypothetical protein